MQKMNRDRPGRPEIVRGTHKRNVLQKNREVKGKIDVYFCWKKDEAGRDMLANMAFLDNGVGTEPVPDRPGKSSPL